MHFLTLDSGFHISCPLNPQFGKIFNGKSIFYVYSMLFGGISDNGTSRSVTAPTSRWPVALGLETCTKMGN